MTNDAWPDYRSQVRSRGRGFVFELFASPKMLPDVCTSCDGSQPGNSAATFHWLERNQDT
ncbi:hypothetical protein ACVW1A_005972 [Bradyrhizobium sp. LB1.3]